MISLEVTIPKKGYLYNSAQTVNMKHVHFIHILIYISKQISNVIVSDGRMNPFRLSDTV